MLPPTIPELVARAGQLPFLQNHVALEAEGGACAHWQDLTLRSVYEPIYDVAMPGAPESTSFTDAIERYGDELGFQAVTQIGGHGPDPFDAAIDDHALVALDRLARTLHAINFFGAHRHGLLFLRVHERLVKSVKYDHGKHFSSVLARFGLPADRVVIELPSAAVAHKTFVGYLTHSYQHHGFKVADKLPDPGRILAVESDMARPDFIKMDATTALRAGMVKALVSYAQRARIPLIFDGVADETQCGLLRQHDVRLMQGQVFAKVTV